MCLDGAQLYWHRGFIDAYKGKVLLIVNTATGCGFTSTGWKQLQAAMDIYRSKDFETFRYILIDRDGNIVKKFEPTASLDKVKAAICDIL